MLPRVLTLSLLATLPSAWLSCMTFSCSSLSPNSCATLSEPTVVSLPNSPCDQGYECRLQDIMDWYKLNATERATVLPCNTAQEVVIGPDWQCANREASKNLMDGSYPKICLSNTDCKLLDGSFNDCVCTPRTSGTQGYCKPNLSSSYFQDYWDLCTLGNNVIKDKYEGYYWFLKSNYAVYYDTTALPACKGNLWEFQQYYSTEVQVTNSATAVLVAAVVFFG